MNTILFVVAGVIFVAIVAVVIVRRRVAPASPAVAVNFSTVQRVGHQTQIDGHLTFDGELTIDGALRGRVDGTTGTLVIGGDVKATIHAERVILRPTSHVDGEVSCASLEIDDGAQFLGHVNMVEKDGGEAAEFILRAACGPHDAS